VNMNGQIDYHIAGRIIDWRIEDTHRMAWAQKCISARSMRPRNSGEENWNRSIWFSKRNNTNGVSYCANISTGNSRIW
jgi:hypothetical protein